MKIAIIFLCLTFISGCKTPLAKVRIAEHNQSPAELVLRAYPCMEKFYSQPFGLPEGFCSIDFFIVIENCGKNPICVGNDWNSWGYTAIKLEIAVDMEAPFPLNRKMGTWYRNFPEFLEIPPKSLLCLPISLDDGLWEPCPPLDKDREERISALLNTGKAEFLTQFYLRGTIQNLRIRDTWERLPDIASPWTPVLFRHNRITVPPERRTSM